MKTLILFLLLGQADELLTDDLDREIENDRYLEQSQMEIDRRGESFTITERPAFLDKRGSFGTTKECEVDKDDPTQITCVNVSIPN